MEHKLDTHIFQGMQIDSDPFRQRQEFLVDAHNVRITSTGEATEMAITSEKSTSNMDININGTILGQCVINNYLVIFTTANDTDRIYIFKKENKFKQIRKIEKNLNFDINHPIESIGIFENENIQKVYWIDGINQPRVINIVADINYSDKPNTYFDFVNTLKLEEDVRITKEFGTGYFPAGSIQYCFNYYNKYGQESNIAWVSPLLYTSFIDRAGSPEETLGNIFNIHISNADNKFDYLRLYSIMRTSENAQPTVRIVKDVKVTDDEFIIKDDYSTGETIDPSSLLYLGGEEVTAGCMTHKDGTLFFGDLEIKRDQITEKHIDLPTNSDGTINREAIEIKESTRTIYPYGKEDYSLETVLHKDNYNTGLFNNAYEKINGKDYCTSPKTFKSGEIYRLGVQFQYKTGKWSDPVFLKDYKVKGTNKYINELEIKEELNTLSTSLTLLDNKGYIKARPIIVQPSLVNQTKLAQGVLCPTVHNKDNAHIGEVFGVKVEIEKATPYVQSSWFTRPFNTQNTITKNGERDYTNPLCNNEAYLNKFGEYYSELQNSFQVSYTEGENPSISTLATFQVSTQWMTFHSPDIQFNEDLWHVDISTLKCNPIGYTQIIESAGDISITTSSPTISTTGKGFVKNTVRSRKIASLTRGCNTLMSGFFYNDAVVEATKEGEAFYYSPLEKHDARYFMIYPWHRSGSLNNDCNRGSDGTRSAVLKRKVIANIKIAGSVTLFAETELEETLKDNKLALFTADQLSLVKILNYSYYGNVDTVINPKGNYSSIIGASEETSNIDNPPLKSYTSAPSINRLIGTCFTTKDKYIVFKDESLAKYVDAHISDIKQGLSSTKDPIRMKYKSTPHAIVRYESALKELTYDDSLYVAELSREEPMPYGDMSDHTLKQHIWIPAGDAVSINNNSFTITWKYGDTYLQRYDCLKTYSFTNEDENSIIDIISFIAETRVNIEGRYDKNKGNLSNLNVSPTNFNLINYGYNQHDNFFTYKILDDDFYKLNKFNNTITWTLEHKAAEDVDKWTSITMASTLDLDGSKGSITSLQNYNNEIYAIQDNGISKVLFNSRVQINASDGVPIEISNNYKVEGKVYITESIGSANKWSVQKTPSGIYFIDTNSKELYNIGGEGLQNVSGTKSFSTWFKKQELDILVNKTKIFYDFNRNDLYVNTPNTTLNFNEKLGGFVSFFDYNKAFSMFNIEDNFYALTQDNKPLWKLFAKQEPCRLLGNPYDYSISFISNPEAGVNKMFTNIDIRADWTNLDNLADGDIYYKRGIQYQFFDRIFVSNEYQKVDEALQETKDRASNIKNRYRVWRVNIPRINRQRISNHWAKITLVKKKENLSNLPMILHDLSVHYYI